MKLIGLRGVVMKITGFVEESETSGGDEKEMI